MVVGCLRNDGCKERPLKRVLSAVRADIGQRTWADRKVIGRRMAANQWRIVADSSEHGRWTADRERMADSGRWRTASSGELRAAAGGGRRGTAGGGRRRAGEGARHEEEADGHGEDGDGEEADDDGEEEGAGAGADHGHLQLEHEAEEEEEQQQVLTVHSDLGGALPCGREQGPAAEPEESGELGGSGVRGGPGNLNAADAPDTFRKAEKFGRNGWTQRRKTGRAGRAPDERASAASLSRRWQPRRLSRAR